MNDAVVTLYAEALAAAERRLREAPLPGPQDDRDAITQAFLDSPALTELRAVEEEARGLGVLDEARRLRLEMT